MADGRAYASAKDTLGGGGAIVLLCSETISWWLVVVVVVVVVEGIGVVVLVIELVLAATVLLNVLDGLQETVLNAGPDEPPLTTALFTSAG